MRLLSQNVDESNVSPEFHFIIFDKLFTIIDCTENINEVFGYKKAELINAHLNIILPESEMFSPYSIIYELLRGRKTESINLNRMKTGNLVLCQWINYPILVNNKLVRVMSKFKLLKIYTNEAVINHRDGLGRAVSEKSKSATI